MGLQNREHHYEAEYHNKQKNTTLRYTANNLQDVQSWLQQQIEGDSTLQLNQKNLAKQALVKGKTFSEKKASMLLNSSNSKEDMEAELGDDMRTQKDTPSDTPEIHATLWESGDSIPSLVTTIIFVIILVIVFW